MPADPIYKRIGALIKARRKKLDNMKQDTLARALGISRGSLANVETGKQGILVHQLYRYAVALQLKPSDLLPPPSNEPAKVDRTDLPLPSDLKGRQKDQVARFFMQQDTTETTQPESNHARTRKGQEPV